jgi:predicted transcriptional regulator
MKWGKEVAERGFTQIPNYLMLINQFLEGDDRLPPSEMVVLLTLVAAWWKPNEPPFPSVRTIADRSALSERQVLRALRSLEERGFLTRKKQKADRLISRNVYDLKPLVGRLKEVAEVFPNLYPRKIKRKSG